MGQKSNPNSLRIGINRTWESQWYADPKQVSMLIIEDFQIRNFIKKFYPKGNISQIGIKRLKKTNKDHIEIDLYTSKIGIIQGPDNKTKNNLIKKIENLIQKEITVNIFEVKKIDKIASLIAQNISIQLQKRAFFRSVQKMAAQKALKSGAKGVKIIISGRLGGAEIARREVISLGLVPSNTFKADIQYGFDEAHTVYGAIGIKVMVNNGTKEGYNKTNIVDNKDAKQIFDKKYENNKNIYMKNDNKKFTRVTS